MNRVAIFRSLLLPISETFIIEQANALKTWQPTLMGFRHIKHGLKATHITQRIIPEAHTPATRALRFWLSLPTPQIVEYLKQENIDVVHAHFGIDATEIWPSVKSADLPLVVTLHGFDINTHRSWWEAGKSGLRRRMYPRRLLKMATHPNVRFIAVSKAIKDRAIEYGIPEEKITVSYIGVNTERFKPGGQPISLRRKRILFVGRMTDKKAPLLMIRAFSKVRKKIPDAELVMIGDGPLLEQSKLLAEQLDTPVKFLGACTSDEVLQQLHKSRVFCLPSVTTPNGNAEGLPISLLEAQACGLPCVTTQHSGNIEAIREDITGIAVAENDIAGTSEALITALNTFNTDQTQESIAQYTSDYFKISNNTQALEKLYNNSLVEKTIAPNIKAKSSLKYLARKIGIRSRFRKLMKKLRATSSLKSKIKKLPTGQKIIYALTPPPELSNIGDHAQVFAIQKWFKLHFPNMPVLEVDKNETIEAQKILLNSISPDDIIFLHSGGNLGDRGMWSETGRRLIINNFKKNRIISLPQTIYFSDTEEGRKQQAISSQIYASHPHLTIIGRDEQSGELARELFPKATVFTAPDFVLSLNLDDFDLAPSQSNNGKVIACLRQDKESIFSIEERIRISTSLTKSATLTDTTLNQPILETERFNIIKKFLANILEHEAMITDRFHGLIFSVIAQKPTVVLPTVDHKLTSAINWFRDIDNVDFISNSQDISKSLELVLNKSNITTPDFNACYFNVLPDLLDLRHVIKDSPK